MYFDQLLDFQIFAFIIPSHIIIVPYFTLWVLDFFNTIQVSNSLDPDQARHFVGPDLGPNCLQGSLQGSSADNKMSGWIWVQTVWKGYQQQRVKYKKKKLVDTTFWLKPWLKLFSFGYNFFYLAKVLATTNSEPELDLADLSIQWA